MLRQKTAWKEAAWVFLWSRLALTIITWIGAMRFPLSGSTGVQSCARDLSPCLFAWFHWDAIAYFNVATRGYSLMRDTVFFPLYPLLVHVVGVLFGGSDHAYYFAGLFVANACFYLALVVFYALVSDLFEASVARNALFYLAFYSYAAFFFAGYTESLFLLLCLATFYFLRQGTTLDYWLAGLCGFLAALTRATGVMLVVPFLVVVLQRFWLPAAAITIFNRTFHLNSEGDQSIVGEMQPSLWRKINTLLPVLLIPAGVLVYMLYLGLVKGNPLAFSTEEAVTWNRPFSLPWTGIVVAIHDLLTTSNLYIFNLLDLIFTLVPIIVLVLGWKRLPLHYNLFVLVMVLFSLSYPMGMVEPLSAAPRYMMVIFPLFIVLAFWSKEHPRFDRLYIACTLPFFVINAVLFISHYWVA